MIIVIEKIDIGTDSGLPLQAVEARERVKTHGYTSLLTVNFNCMLCAGERYYISS